MQKLLSCLWVLVEMSAAGSGERAPEQIVESVGLRTEITCKPIVRHWKKKLDFGSTENGITRSGSFHVPMMDLTLRDGKREYKTTTSLLMLGFKPDPQQVYSFRLYRRRKKDPWQLERVLQEGKQLFPPPEYLFKNLRKNMQRKETESAKKTNQFSRRPSRPRGGCVCGDRQDAKDVGVFRRIFALSVSLRCNFDGDYVQGKT